MHVDVVISLQSMMTDIWRKYPAKQKIQKQNKTKQKTHARYWQAEIKISLKENIISFADQ